MSTPQYKTVFVKAVGKDDDATALYEHLRKYLQELEICHVIEVTIGKAILREKSVVENLTKIFEEKYPVDTEVKVHKKGLHKSPLIKRPEIEPGTKGKVVSVDSGSYHPFHVKFENGKTIYCSHCEIEED